MQLVKLKSSCYNRITNRYYCEIIAPLIKLVSLINGGKTDMNNICFSSEDFLEDVKYQIKQKYKNQDNYAKKLNYSRKVLNRILNSGDEISIYWINIFCSNLDMKMEDYMYPRAM